MEEGKLTVNEPAGKYIPTFEHTTVLTRAENSTATTVVAAKRPILIKDLLTHTAGINYGQQPEFAPLYEPKGLGPAAGFGSSGFLAGTDPVTSPGKLNLSCGTDSWPRAAAALVVGMATVIVGASVGWSLSV